MRRITFFVAGVAGAALVASARSRRLRRLDFKGTSVVITGGSRGLGLALARAFAYEGAKLTLLARDREELERAQMELIAEGADVQVYPCDVRKRDEVLQTMQSVVETRGRIEVLINNAGIVQVGPCENMDVADFADSIEVHAWAPLYTMLAVTPHMKRQGYGRIVNISSIGGLVAIPHLLPYSMGKFALTGLSDGFRAELSKDGIHVTTVAPGLMRTGSHVNAFFKGQHRKEFGWFSVSSANPLLSTSSERAARKIVDACRYGDPRLIINLSAKLLHMLNANFAGLTSATMKMAGNLLPGPVDPRDSRLHTGWQSQSAVSPSFMTRPADRAIFRNNEIK